VRFLVIRLRLGVPFISLSSIVFSLQAINLSRSRFIVMAPDLLFHSVRSRLTEHIRYNADISDLRSDISSLAVLTYLN
jgi:hypothetical protein